MSQTNKMSPLHLARGGKMWGNIQWQIHREEVSSWIPLGLFVWEMKRLRNTGSIREEPAPGSRRSLGNSSEYTAVTPTESLPSRHMKEAACGSLLSVDQHRQHNVASASEAPPPPCFSAGTYFKALLQALIFKVKSDHRLQILMHSAPDASDMLHS